MSEIKLNLARKWRSYTFDEIVGQDVSIRMLKNSLYLKHYFPVYLFSGQRGCGKTSTARVFATALNCENLEIFQKEPKKQLIPCLTCHSCVAMQSNRHPDFVEIDAASHTGVDNIRALIDSASLLPLMGSKKIYLIDEAHMLSKAAFNALLKILEEPPQSVIFILATTDPHKIIETVRSRCFQLLFGPIEDRVLYERLEHVCTKENISFDSDGLQFIIKQTDGSVRDALNLLETVRFSSSHVSAQAVRNVLGYLDDAAVFELFLRVLDGNPMQLLTRIKQLQWHRFSAARIWQRMVELIRSSLWIKYGVDPDHFLDMKDHIVQAVRSVSPELLSRFLQMMYDHELSFNRSTIKHDVLEMILLAMCHCLHKKDPAGGAPSSVQPVVGDVVPEDDEEQENEDGEQDDEEENEDDQEGAFLDPWKQFLHLINQLNDPIVSSVFAQGVLSQDDHTKNVAIVFPKELQFFRDSLINSQSVWQSFIHQLYGKTTEVALNFTGESVQVYAQRSPVVTAKSSHELPAPIRKAVPVKTASTPQRFKKDRFDKNVRLFGHEVPVAINDCVQWPLVQLAVKHIPGTLTEIRES